MQTIYIDVLIILNIYVNCFLLRITARITSSPLKALRCIAASIYGSLFSLMILAPELPFILNIAIKLAAAVTVVIAAFGIHSKMRLLKNTLSFFAANFILAGAVYAAYFWLKPSFMHFSNSYFYIDFSLLLLIICTAVMYLIISVFRHFSDKSPPDCYRIIIRFREKIFTLNALADTGNSLTDFFSGRPVVICGRNELEFPEDFSDTGLPAGFRLIPCSTVSENGVIPVFRPDELLIINTLTNERKSVDVMVGLGKNDGKAIFNPKLLNY
ncbi:MAG: sigma-E processing peptidase SpoIIGA [Ruminococcus sp.]|nr:sigma-E processing peptidase SpoIIGA [Ruminococcus sp.]